jgi:hypothetical protein
MLSSALTVLCQGVEVLGSGLAPYWASHILFLGFYEISLNQAWAWAPHVCRLCLGWGVRAPMLDAIPAIESVKVKIDAEVANV